MEEVFNNKGIAMEKEYYYADNGQQFGPFSFSELKNKNIKSNTLVWCAGMDNWQPAVSVVELSDLFKRTVPPPLNVPTEEHHIEKKSEIRPPVIPSVNESASEPKYHTLAKLTKIFALIGLISGGIMHIFSFPVMFGRDSYYNYYSGYYRHGMDSEWGIMFFFLSLFFIAFSLISMINASRYLKNK